MISKAITISFPNFSFVLTIPSLCEHVVQERVFKYMKKPRERNCIWLVIHHQRLEYDIILVIAIDWNLPGAG